jgi:hypothetical protein
MKKCIFKAHNIKSYFRTHVFCVLMVSKLFVALLLKIVNTCKSFSYIFEISILLMAVVNRTFSLLDFSKVNILRLRVEINNFTFIQTSWPAYVAWLLNSRLGSWNRFLAP